MTEGADYDVEFPKKIFTMDKIKPPDK